MAEKQAYSGSLATVFGRPPYILQTDGFQNHKSGLISYVLSVHCICPSSKYGYIALGYDIMVIPAYERLLDQGRFANLSLAGFEYATTLQSPRRDMSEMIDWISDQKKPWNIRYGGGKHVSFSFDDQMIAVEFKLRFG